MPDPEQARQAVESGRVVVSGAPVSSLQRLVAAGEPIVVLPPPPRFVGRGGEKLDAGLDRFGIAVAGRRVLDVGASTGGFTDCLLQRGAVAVLAVDVGRNQLHERLRADPRVESRERTDIRHLRPDDVGGPFALAVADVSFIPLRSIATALLALATPDADLVLLVKPQFEATHAEAARGRGVISDPAIWRRVLEEVIGALNARGAAIMDVMASPLRGADGNVEFLLHAVSGGARSRASTTGPVDLDALLASVTAGGPG